MYIISGLSLATHELFKELHVHMSIYGGVVLTWGVSFCVLALMSVRCLV